MRRDADAETTAGGLHVPNQWQTHELTGVVVAVHDGEPQPGGYVRPCEVAIGERVLFGPYSGSDVLIGGVKLTIMPEAELLAVLE